MKLVALISGGKDSCYNMMRCVQEGHETVCLANLHPSKEVNEIDSFMYQSVGHQAVELFEGALGLPLIRTQIQGFPLNQDLHYSRTENDEVEDLYHLLSAVKKKFPEVKGVSIGAIFSMYQKARVENVCSRLELEPLCMLWKQDQEALLNEMIGAGVNAILIKVAALGLTKEHIGKNLSEMRDHLRLLNSKYGVNICGEGGEYETFVTDCPLFKKRICIDDYSIICDDYSGVAYMHPKKFHLESKF